MSVRRTWIEGVGSATTGAGIGLSVSRQCTLAGVARSTVYGPGRGERVSDVDAELLRLIDAEYTRRPFYGSRRMRVSLRAQGYTVSRKRVQRLMGRLGLAGMLPGPHTSQGHPEHPIYPYLLRGQRISRPGQVWSADITYIRLARGWAYLVAIIDWYSRQVLGWRVSNTLEAGFCVDCLEETLHRHPPPEIFNTDQGAQFTSAAFTHVLRSAGIAISMDGRGRALDNVFVERLWRTVKYEDVYPKGYETLPQLLMGLTEYFVFYNTQRPHQSLGYRTPEEIHRSGQGGGVTIADHFGQVAVAPPGDAAISQENLGQRQTAATAAD